MSVGFKRKKGLFGSPVDYQQAMQQPMPQAPIEQPKEQSRFGMIAQNVMGNVGDAISQYYGGSPVFARSQAMMQQQQQAAAEAAAAQRKRAQDLADWRYKEQWKRDNPMPVNNDTERDYNLVLEMYGKKAADEFMQNNLINPTFYTGPDGRRYPNPSTAAPREPVGKLTPLGGPASNSGGGFR